MGEFTESVPDKTGKCVVCGHQTHDRIVTLSHTTGKVAYRTWRCEDFEPCAERRAASKKRRKSSATKRRAEKATHKA